MRVRSLSMAAWAFLAGVSFTLCAHGQSLLSYPGDRAQGGSVASSGSGLSPKRIATLGDSNTEGFGLASNETYPARLLSQLGNSYTVDNYGVGGYTCTQVDAKWTASVASRAYGVVVLMCGTNDHRTNLDNAATIYARITTLVAKIRATGARVVLLTVLPAGTSTSPSYTAAMETQRDALNALIRGTSDVTVVDLDPLLQGAGEPPALSATLDGLHLNAAGATTVATAIRNAL